MNHHLRRLVFLKHCLVFSEACVILHERLSRVGMHHLAVVAVVPGSGTVRWSVGCGAAGVVELSVFPNKSIVSRLTSNQLFHKKTRLTAQQPPLISHTTTRRWLRVHDSRSRTRGFTPTISATTPAVVEKWSCSSAPALAAQRAREHQGLDKQLPARSEVGQE